jgi:Trypsin-like peptidase domain
MKVKTKIYILIAIILFDVLVCQAPTYSIPLNQIKEIAEKVTVKIKYAYAPGEDIETESCRAPIETAYSEPKIPWICEINPYQRGTGTIIYKSGTSYFVVTTAKTVDLSRDYEINGETVKYKDIFRVSGTELAIMRFNSKKIYQVAEISNISTLKAEDTIYIAGFHMPSKALFEPILEFNTGNIKTNNQSEISYSSSNNLRVGGDGGGLFNKNGKLVGIRLQKNGSENLNRALNINEFINSARKSGLNIASKNIVSEALPLANMAKVIGMNKKFIVTGDRLPNYYNNDVQLWKIGESKPLLNLPYDINLYRIRDLLGMSADGKTFATGGYQIEILALKDDKLKSVKKLAHKDDIWISSLSISTDGKMLAAGGINRRSKQTIIEIWNIKTGKLLDSFNSQIKNNNSYTDTILVSISDDSKTVIGMNDSIIEVWSLPKGKLSKTISLQTYNGKAVALDGKKLLLSDSEGNIELIQIDY